MSESKTVKELRKVSARIKADQERQKDLVRQASAEGLSLRQIADVTGLGHNTIKRWLDA